MIRIKDWSEFQHYKNRNPPWIRLYARLLDDPELYELSDKAARILPLLWLIASRHSTDGSLPAIKTLAFQLRIASDVLAELLTELNHWVTYDDSDMLATCSQHAIPEQSRAEQSITERERETEKKDSKIESDFALFWSHVKNKTGKKNALREFKKLGSRRPPVQVMIDSLLAQYKHKDQCDARRVFCPEMQAMERWIKNERWDDEVTPIEDSNNCGFEIV